MSSTEKPIRVLVAGLGNMGRSHALAYHNNVGATVRARSIVEPWTISAVAYLWSYWSLRDGLIIAYVASMVAALIAALIPLDMVIDIDGTREQLELSGADGLLFRRNSVSGAVEAVPWKGEGIALNAALHAN